jgi:hypothetical protein
MVLELQKCISDYSSEAIFRRYRSIEFDLRGATEREKLTLLPLLRLYVWILGKDASQAWAEFPEVVELERLRAS